MSRRTRGMILIVSSLIVFVGTISLIGAAIASRRARNDVRFGIEELDVLIEDEAFDEARAMITWLAERATTVGDGLRVYKRAYELYELGGSSELPANVSVALLEEFPGNTVIRELTVYSAVLNDEADRALALSRNGNEVAVRSDHYALALLAADQAHELAEASGDESQVEGALLLTTLDETSTPESYDAAWQLTQDGRYAVNAALLYLTEGALDRAGQLMDQARVSDRSPLFAYDYYLSRGDYATARRIAQEGSDESFDGLLREADLALYTARRDEAIRVYREIAGRGYESPELLINTAYLSESRATRETVFEQALALYPDNWQVVDQAARFFASFDPERARRILYAHRAGPHAEEARYLELRIDNEPMARGYPARVWRLIEDSDDEAALRYAVWYFRSHGSPADAAIALERARTRLGRQNWIVFYEALLAVEAYQWERAAALFEESHEMLPTWRAAYNAALAWYRAGWPERGARMLGRARQLAAYSQDRSRSEVYTASARTTPVAANALEYLEEALSISPGSPEALFLMRTIGRASE